MSADPDHSGDDGEDAESDSTASKPHEQGGGGDSASGHPGESEAGEDPVSSPGPYGNPASDEEALRHEQEEAERE